MMRLWLKSIVAVMVLGIITLALIGCDKSFEAGAKENTVAFFRTVSRKQCDQIANVEDFSQKSLSVLHDRLFIQMPAGAGVMSEKQRKALHARELSDSSEEQYIVWGGSGEVLLLSIKEQFFSSDQMETELANHLVTYQSWADQAPFKIGDNAVAISMPLEQIARSREGELEFMRAMVQGAGNTLISIEFSLYTTAFDHLEERIAFFKEVATSIVKSATPGTRILGAEEQTVTFENYTMQIPKGYCVTNLQKKVAAFNQEDEENAIVEIKELVPWDDPFCSIRIEFGAGLELRFPESVTSSKEDTLLGKPIVWRRQQGIIQEKYPFDLYETIIPLKGNESLKILLAPKIDSDVQQLFNIIHTLEKK